MSNNKQNTAYRYETDLNGTSWQCTYDDNGNHLSYEDSNGINIGFDKLQTRNKK